MYDTAPAKLVRKVARLDVTVVSSLTGSFTALGFFSAIRILLQACRTWIRPVVV